MGMFKKVISLWSWLRPWGTLWWISIGIVICKWEFWFFDLLMANFSLRECFSTFHNYLYKSGPLQFGGLVILYYYYIIIIRHPTQFHQHWSRTFWDNEGKTKSWLFKVSNKLYKLLSVNIALISKFARV